MAAGASAGGAAAEGAVVTLAFSLPDIVIQRLKSVAITASVNGTKLKSAQFDKPGANAFTADVPSALLTGESVTVDFALDKTVPPDVDKRNLGVVATSIGISSKYSGRFFWMATCRDAAMFANA